MLDLALLRPNLESLFLPICLMIGLFFLSSLYFVAPGRRRPILHRPSKIHLGTATTTKKFETNELFIPMDIRNFCFWWLLEKRQNVSWVKMGKTQCGNLRIVVIWSDFTWNQYWQILTSGRASISRRNWFYVKSVQLDRITIFYL